MRTRTDPTAPLFDFAFIDASELGPHSNMLQAILEKRLDGVIVRNVLTPQTVASVLARLEEDTDGRTKFPMFKEQADAPYTVGQAIVTAGVDLVDYFRDAALQTARLQRVFAGQQDYERSIAHRRARPSHRPPCACCPRATRWACTWATNSHGCRRPSTSAA
jgi:hypothetical protein